MADNLRKHKGSKKSKKSWRKHTDIDDVEEHLEDERRDERTGGTVSDKKDDVIFFIEAKISEEKSNLNFKPKVTNKHIADAEDDDEEVYVSRKDRLMKRLANEESEEKNKKQRNRQVKNIWGQEVMTVKDAFLEPTVKKPKVKPATVGTGKSSLEAITKPHPGSSYNPDYESHQNLLSDAHEEELKKLKEKEKLNRKVKMIGVDELKNQSQRWLKEMSEGLNDDESKRNADENDFEEEEEAEESEKDENTKKQKVQKTMKQKRKEKLKKTQEKHKLEEKRNKKNVHDIYRVKQIKKEIEKDANSSLQRQMKKDSEENDAVRTKRLGKHKFEDANIAVQLSGDLSGSLRQLKPEGSLLEDRFKSLQKRNIIEPRKRVIPRRTYKRKIYVRRSYKTKTIKDFQSKC